MQCHRFPRWQKRKKEPKSWWDVWAPRINHLSQFGLFAFALIGFFYVVLPVYQKSVLEEAVAKLQVDVKTASEAVERKEAQLAQASEHLSLVERDLATRTDALDKTYAKVRAYAVRGFVGF